MKPKSKPAETGRPSPTPVLDALIQAEPDLVDRIFEYIIAEIPELVAAARLDQLKSDVRSEFAGERGYVAKRPPTERQRLALQVLALFNGRNATEVARKLQLGRTTVYRILKQPGKV
jgi:Mor family transcriptional regulator